MQVHSESQGIVTVSHGPFSRTFRKDAVTGKLVVSGTSTFGGRPSKGLAKKMAAVADEAIKNMERTGYQPKPDQPRKNLFRITETLKQTDAFSTA